MGFDMKKYLTVVAVAAVLAMPVHSQTITPHGGNVVYVKGTPLSVSDLKNAEVDIVPFGEQDKKTIAFMVSIRSKASQSYEVGTENISAALTDGTVLRVIPASEMVAKVRKRAKWGSFWERLGAVGDAMRDDDTTSYTTGTVTSPYGIATYNGTTTTSNPNGAAYRAQSRQTAEQNVRDIQQSADASVASIQDNVLQRETVFPGQEIQRKIVFERNDIKSPNAFSVTVTFAGEIHSFSYALN